MLTKSEIRRWTAPITFDKGVALYEGHKVLTIEVETEGTKDSIDAEVKGSGRNEYYVSMTLNTKLNTIEDYYCECPAYDAYPRLCKHCVATLLEYRDYKSKREKEILRQGDLSSLASLKGMRMRTTPIIQNLLTKMTETRALELKESSLSGKVHLEPYLTCRLYEYRLEFKIGTTRMYVLKDIGMFVDAVENKEVFSYGKHLEFLHTRQAFDESSRPLVDFIAEWYAGYREKNMSSFYSAKYYAGTSKIRSMTLTGRTLEQFLLAVGDEPFLAQIIANPEMKWCVTKETLPQKMKIQGEKNGLEITVQQLHGFKGLKYQIYFIGGKVYLDPIERVLPAIDFMECLSRLSGQSIYIAKEDVPAFCRNLLPELEKVYEIEKVSFDAKKYGLVKPDFEIYLDAPNKDMITCKVIAAYGEHRFYVYHDDNQTGMRDVVQETKIGELVGAYCNAYDEENHCMVIAEDESKIYELLVDGIQHFQSLGQVFISDVLKKYQITENPRVTVGVSLSGDMLELTLSANEMSKSELIEILSKYNSKKKYYRLKNGDFVQMDEEGMVVLQDIREDLNLTQAQLKQDIIELPKYRAMYLDMQGRDNSAISMIKDKAFRSLIRNMKTVEDNDFELPASLESVLREYQKEGFFWLKTLQFNGFGGILADDMGLGKTLQVICFLLSEMQQAEETENRRTLIVAPASLVYNWSNEIQHFAPELAIRSVAGNKEEREEQLRVATEHEILLTSYDLLRRDIDLYDDMQFFCQVIDEAQYIKNHNTKAAKAVKQIQAGFKIALTGTPVENKLSELWSIFDYLMPGFLYPYSKFRQELEVPIVQNQDEHALQRLQKMIGPFVLRRLKKDVLKDLPDKLEENIYAPLEGEQQKLYDARVQRMQMMLDGQSEDEFRTSKIQILSELTRLRQLCCDPALIYDNYKENSTKLDMCIDLIENAISGGHKILLFSQFTSMLQNLQDRMEERKISFFTLTGSTNKEKRIQMVNTFNEDDTSVFCISLKAGGTGLNLTAADVVIHYDPWWNLAVQNQATDRAHRIGQKNVVTVYRLVMKNTIEENIIRLQEKKKELAEEILGGERVGSASFSKEEIMDLLS